MCPRNFVGDGTVADAGRSATRGERKRGSVVAAAIASRVPGSGVSGGGAADTWSARRSGISMRASGEKSSGIVASPGMPSPLRFSAFVLATLLALGCRRGAPEGAAPPRAERTPRDVLLVTIDTLRYDAVGFDGNARGTTPRLDELAGTGRVFTSAHA